MAGRGSLPSPPSDIRSRQLPIRRIRGELFRIHSSAHAPVHFSKGRGRFDDPAKEYGVLYAAMQEEGAFAEVFLRNLSDIVIPEVELMARCLSTIKCLPVDVADLTGSGLRQLSCDNRLSTEMPYGASREWSRAIYEHSDHVAGIMYLSRHNPKFKCVALFERAERRVKVAATEELMRGARRVWTAVQIEKYRLNLLPA